MNLKSAVLMVILAGGAAAQQKAEKQECPNAYPARFLAYHEGVTSPGMEAPPIHKGCVFIMSDTEIVVQKVPHGYLFTGNEERYGDEETSYDLAMLVTTEKIARGGSPSGYATYVGTMTYTTIDGFEKTVLVFKANGGRR
jgi:hypothetical protein